MSTKIYVGSLPWDINSEDLRAEFAKFGWVIDAIVLTDRETGRSRGFGFVTFDTEEQASQAVMQMDGQEFHGRQIKVTLDHQEGGGRFHGRLGDPAHGDGPVGGRRDPREGSDYRGYREARGGGYGPPGGYDPPEAGDALAGPVP